MSVRAVLPATSVQVAVGAASAQFATSLVTTKPPGQALYQLSSSTACWFTQGANPTASAGPGSHFLPANTPAMIDGIYGAKIAVIQEAAGGKASITQVAVVR